MDDWMRTGERVKLVSMKVCTPLDQSLNFKNSPSFPCPLSFSVTHHPKGNPCGSEGQEGCSSSSLLRDEEQGSRG